MDKHQPKEIKDRIPSNILSISILLNMYILLTILARLGNFNTVELGAMVLIVITTQVVFFSSVVITAASLILAITYAFKKQDGVINLMYAFFIGLTPYILSDLLGI